MELNVFRSSSENVSNFFIFYILVFHLNIFPIFQMWIELLQIVVVFFGLCIAIKNVFDKYLRIILKHLTLKSNSVFLKLN